MSVMSIIIILVGIMAVAGVSALAYFLLGGQSKSGVDVRTLMGAGQGAALAAGPGRSRADMDVSEIKENTKREFSGKSADDLATRLFRAGFFSKDDRKKFFKFQLFTPIFTTPICAAVMVAIGENPLLVTVGVLLGVFIGFAWPLSWLERQIRNREEETMYYLPLVIEQVSIGVSSSLDIGPCVANVIEMANERDSHNPVTEMFIHVERLIRSGLSLEDALIEVGETSGVPDVKHAFMFLAQCAKHGGEISKQLQELADAVMVQRQTQVEGRISQLPVKATGPLVMVFAGFFSLLLSGLFVKLMSVFGNM